MTTPIILTDETYEATLNGEAPALLLFTDGSGLRGDFKTAFNKAADEEDQIIVAQLDPAEAPQAAARFEVGKKPVMIAWAAGETQVRRSRPWGTDVPLALDVLREHLPASTVSDSPAPSENQSPNEEQTTVYSEPVNVTDDTFQAEVIESDLPVLVDFWAEWCGPCRQVAPVLDKLAKEFEGQVKIAKVDVDANPGLSQSFQIRSIPNMMAIKRKTIVFNQPGALPEPALRDLIGQLVELEVPDPEEQQATEQPEN